MSWTVRVLLLRKNVFKFVLAIICPLIMLPNVYAEGSIDAGKNKVSMCVGCHGIPNYKTAFPKTYRVPRIAGQRSGYIISALKAYRAGERGHPSMQAVAGSMSDDDIADLAAYYASLK